jgi:O-antigen/teichoic acid export membrane protein
VEEKTTSMIILKAIGYTALVALLVIALIATLYVSIWIMLAVGVVLLFSAIRSVLQGKEHLVRHDSSKL